MSCRKLSAGLFAGIIIIILGVSPAAAAPGFERVSETGIRVLEVEASLLNVEINGGSGSTLTGWGEEIPKNVIVKSRRRGDVLRIWVEKRFAPFAFRQKGRLFFDLPENVDLDIRTSSGEIIIRNMDSERLVAASSSGNISVSRIKSKVEVKSSSGDLSLGMIEGSVRAESSSGRLEVINLVGEVNATASSGNLRLSAVEGAVTASSSSGRIVFSSTTGALYAHASSGDITGEDIVITGDSTFKTSSGDIDIEFLNPLNELSFRLTSSSGGLQVGNLRGEKSLAAGEGKIRITGESSSGNQSYK